MLKIIVPVKQVPDMVQVKFNIAEGHVDRSSAGAEINPFDLNAIELALTIKDKVGANITVISMGPPKAEAALRDALARGADNAILLTDRAFSGADTWSTSYTLAAAAKKLNDFDLIICGEKTVDGDTGQVGPQLAEHLGIPHVAYVSKMLEVNESIDLVADMDEESYYIKGDFPLLITVTKDINVPRLPSFHDKLKARKAKVAVWGADDLAEVADPSEFGGVGSPTSVKQITAPDETGRRGHIFRIVDEKCINEIAGFLTDFIK